MVVRKIAQNQDAIQKQEALLNEYFGLDQVVYAMLSNRTDNRILTQPVENNSKFDRFLVDMNDLHRGNPVSEEIVLLDLYLGNLGETVFYPFSSDTYYTDPWISLGQQYDTRNVIDRAGDNVIDRATGSNVIHNTNEEAHRTGTRSTRWPI